METQQPTTPLHLPHLHLVVLRSKVTTTTRAAHTKAPHPAGITVQRLSPATIKEGTINLLLKVLPRVLHKAMVVLHKDTEAALATVVPLKGPPEVNGAAVLPLPLKAMEVLDMADHLLRVLLRALLANGVVALLPSSTILTNRVLLLASHQTGTVTQARTAIKSI